MSKVEAKTRETADSVYDFIKKVPDLQKQRDSMVMIEIMKRKSGCEPKMWGPTIIGFGKYHYKYESGHEGDAPLVGFSPRKAAMVLYLATSFDQKEVLLKKFGKHKTGKCCIYFKKIEDIDIAVLEKMIVNSIKFFKAEYR